MTSICLFIISVILGTITNRLFESDAFSIIFIPIFVISAVIIFTWATSILVIFPLGIYQWLRGNKTVGGRNILLGITGFIIFILLSYLGLAIT